MMAKPPTIPTQFKVRGKEAFLHKVVLEVRYRHGYLYLDRCGRVINSIQKDYPDWLTSGEGQSPQGSTLFNSSSKAQFSFGSKKYDQSIESSLGSGAVSAEQLSHFCSDSESLHEVVADILELKEYVRIGFRTWLIFGTRDKNVSTMLLRQCAVVPAISAFETALSGTVDDLSFAINIVSNDRSCRIGIQSVERPTQVDLGKVQATVKPHELPKGQREALLNRLKQKKIELDHPSFGVMVDLDWYVDDPDEIHATSFIQEGFERTPALLEKMFDGGSQS